MNKSVWLMVCLFGIVFLPERMSVAQRQATTKSSPVNAGDYQLFDLLLKKLKTDKALHHLSFREALIINHTPVSSVSQEGLKYGFHPIPVTEQALADFVRRNRVSGVLDKYKSSLSKVTLTSHSFNALYDIPSTEQFLWRGGIIVEFSLPGYDGKKAIMKASVQGHSRHGAEKFYCVFKKDKARWMIVDFNLFSPG
jgi:hypothetical protein